jgi:hypothetical protein
VAAVSKPLPIGAPPDLADPVVGPVPDAEERWSFSFLIWDQAKFFGLSELKPKQVVDLLTGLRETESVMDSIVEGDKQTKDRYHFHIVDWTKAKVKFSRDMISWLPKHIAANEKEWPIYQVGLGKGRFRILGLISSHERRFYVVLLDPYHNAQKAGKYETGTYCEPVLDS